MANENIVSRGKLTLQIRTLHELAKICWGNFVLRESIEEAEKYSNESRVLTSYLDGILKNIPVYLNKLSEALYTDLPKHLESKLTDALILLYQGFYEALVWETKCRSSVPFTILNPTKAGEYQAINYIDATGHFDELSWAKRFVSDEKQFVHFKFEFACFYCFEEVIKNLWGTMKAKSQLPCKGKLVDIKSVCGDLVASWVSKLENKYEAEYEVDLACVDDFNSFGLRISVEAGHENASRYFWSRCSESEKEEFLTKFYVNSLREAASYGYTGVTFFIYSILSLEQKKNLLREMFGVYIRYDELVLIWNCLLLSPFYEAVLNDIRSPPVPIPPSFYNVILCLLVKDLKSHIPSHKVVFKALWKEMCEDQRMEDLDENIRNLAKIRATDLLRMIILPLSCPVKEKLLLHNLNITCTLRELRDAGDYDGMHTLLLLFLFDLHPISQKIRLRAGALNFINSFIGSNSWLGYSKIQDVPKLKLKEMFNVLDSLQGSLRCLDQLLERVGGMQDSRIKDENFVVDVQLTERLNYLGTSGEENSIKRQRLF